MRALKLFERTQQLVRVYEATVQRKKEGKKEFQLVSTLITFVPIFVVPNTHNQILQNNSPLHPHEVNRTKAI